MAESEKLRKIFIGGLNWNTTEEVLKDYFSRWGTIVDCVIMKREGRSRGFGFVTYSTPDSVDEVLKIKSHVLDDREIEPKRSVPRDESNHPGVLSKTRKIFVGGLASTTTEEDITDYFNGLCKKSDMGSVIDVDLKKDRENPNRIRGFAFVTFDNDDIVDKVCHMKYHEIKMKQCEVKKAEPQAAMRKRDDTPEYRDSRSSRDRDREYRDRDYRDREHRDRGDRDRGDRDRGDRDRDRDRREDRGHHEKTSRNGTADTSAYGYVNPFAFGAGGFAPGFGFGGMGFGGFPAGAFGYGGFPSGFGGFGFGQGAAGSLDKAGYGTDVSSVGYSRTSDRDVSGSSSRSQLPAAAAAAREGSAYSGYGQLSAAALASGMGANPAEWPAAAVAGGMPSPAMFGAGYGYGVGAAVSAAPSDSPTAKGFPAAAPADFPVGSYSQMSSAYGPTSRTSAPRGLPSADSKSSSRGYRPY